MFWSRVGREARRHQVLDELLELDPSYRQARMEAAVAAGDVRAGEVDETLRLVHRLDALRVMKLYPSSESSTGDAPPATELALPSPAKPSAAVRVRKARRAAGRAKRPVSPKHTTSDKQPSRSSVRAATRPVDLAVTADRTSRDESAAPRLRTGSQSSRQRRSPVLTTVILSSAVVPLHSDEALDLPRHEPNAEPSWPDISWLRP